MHTHSGFSPCYVGAARYEPSTIFECAKEALAELGYGLVQEDEINDNIFLEAELDISGEVYRVTCWWAAGRETQIETPTIFAPQDQAEEIGILVTGSNAALADIQSEQIADRVEQMLFDIERDAAQLN